MIEKISIQPGKKSHRITFYLNGRTIIQYVQADIPVEKVQKWSENLYSKLLKKERIR